MILIQYKRNFEFSSFLGLTICNKILSHDSGRRSRTTAPNLPHDQEGEMTNTLTTILFSTFGTVFNKLHEIFNAFL